MLDLLDLLTHQPRHRSRDLDAVRDHLAIMRRAFFRDFAVEIRVGAALALFRVFAIPRLSAMLAHTGAWARGPEGRLGRTVDLLTTLIADGYDAPRGAAALARINAAHARHAIANEDMLYVLTTFVTEPARVIDEVGPRPLRAVELEAAHVFWVEVGRRMGIREIPGSFAAMAAFARAYEDRHRGPADSNAVVADAALTAIVGRLPGSLAAVGRELVSALLAAPVRRACGLPDPVRPLQWALAGVAAARRRVPWASPGRST